MSKLFAKKLLDDVVTMTNNAGTSHVGGCLSCLDIISVLFSQIINIDKKNLKFKDRDRFILSKGHTAAIVYSALANLGFYPKKWLSTFIQDGTKLPGHIDHKVPGVEFSTGSLGHGLSVGLGMAISMKRNKIKSKAYVLLSDGEMNTGSTWESIMFAGHHKVDNLIAIVDKNKIQSFGETKDIIKEIKTINKKGELVSYYNDQINFDYRESNLPIDTIVISAKYECSYGDKEEIKIKMKDIKEKREKFQPIKSKTSGSTFKNPKHNYAAKLIELSGCKGLRVGDAIVSHKHANFLINNGKATASQIEDLGSMIIDKVYHKFNISLNWEIKIIG